MTRQQQPASPTSTQSGFTIVESLLAIIIVSALMVAIAPVIVLSVATRVQARRVELATQVARSYVDGVRSGAIQAPNSVIVPVIRPNVPVPKFLDAMPAPASTLASCAPNPTPTSTNFYCDAPPIKRPNPNLAGNLYCMNLDGNPGGCSTRSPKSFIIQAFRTALPRAAGAVIPDLTDDGSKGYVLGVRVYRAEAFDGVGTLQASAPPLGGTKARTYTGGTGDKKSPLVELTTEVRGTNASDETNYNDLCKRLGGCL
jgi:type II secretory pathway pseudopilin PulG